MRKINIVRAMIDIEAIRIIEFLHTSWWDSGGLISFTLILASFVPVQAVWL